MSEPIRLPEPSMSVEARVATIRSLIGHRKPSQHLLDLIALACAGGTWDDIAELDAAVRR